MDIQTLVIFFRWSTIISFALLMLSTALVMMMKSLVYQIHGKMFGMKPKEIDLMIYGYLGILKIMILVFIFVPYLALSIMT